MLAPFVPSASFVALFSLASLSSQDPTWPPTGPTWETDPASAFARARKERKAVMAYVATAD